MQIILIRHGKPAVELTGIARGRDLAAIAKAYDASGIVDRPPPETLEKLRHADYVIFSNLPRSLESARLGVCRIARSGSIALSVTAWVTWPVSREIAKAISPPRSGPDEPQTG